MATGNLSIHRLPRYGGEWALGVALVMELWPDKSRAWLAGVIGSAGNLGYVLIALMSLVLGNITGEIKSLLKALSFSSQTIEWLTGNSGWRVLMLCATFPALLTFLIRLMVPESQKWEKERERGHTRSDGRDLLGVLIGALAALGIITIWAIEAPFIVRLPATLLLLVVAVFGYVYPIRRNLARSGLAESLQRLTTRRVLLAACLSGVPLLGTWASVQLAPTWIDEITGKTIKECRAFTQVYSALGATFSCLAIAWIGVYLPRRWTYFGLCIASLGIVVGFFRFNTGYDYSMLASVFCMGGIAAAFYGWLPLYLPELFPTAMRAAGQGFGFNFGRIIAAVGVLQLPVIKSLFADGYASACPILALVYLVGMVLIWFAPETKDLPLPE